MKWIFFFVLVAQFGNAHAFERTPQNKCTDIDLRSEILGEVRNQKNVSWCYAFSAADMLTSHYGLSEKVSAADIAINYNDSDMGNLIRWVRTTFRLGDEETFMMPHQTGFNKVALERGMRDGYCPERIFPSESWTKMTRSGNDWIESKIDLRPAMLEIFALLKRQKELNVENLPVYFHFKNVESPDEFLALLKTSTHHNFYGKLRNSVCMHDRIKFQKSYPAFMHVKDAKLFSTVNKELDKQNIVGLDYDSRILKDSNNRSIRVDEMHTSSFVGRRWSASANECQYLVRNSYGEACNRYDLSYECQDGNIWLNESQLYPNMTSIVYLQKPSF